MTATECSAPIKGHEGNSAERQKCPVHGRKTVLSAMAAGAVPTLGPPRPAGASFAESVRNPKTGVYSPEIHYLGEEIHREDGGPAAISFHVGTGEVHTEAWIEHDKRHRVGEPAVLNYYKDGSVRREEWCLGGVRTRPGNEPVEVNYREDGTVESKTWALGDGNERKTIYREDGSIAAVEKHFGLPGRGVGRHCEDAPAVTTYNADGSVASEEWYTYGSPRAQMRGEPDTTSYNADGSIQSEEWDSNRPGGGKRAEYGADGRVTVTMSDGTSVITDESGKISHILGPDDRTYVPVRNGPLVRTQQVLDDFELRNPRSGVRNPAHYDRYVSAYARTRERDGNPLSDEDFTKVRVGLSAPSKY